MLSDGISLKTVSERAGHASASITLDTYTHAMPNSQEQAAISFGEDFERHLERAKNKSVTEL